MGPLTTTSAEELATHLGSRPLLLLGVLVAGAVGTLLGMAGVVRVADRHARKAWSRAARAWRWLAERPFMRRLEARVPFVWRVMRRLSATEYLVLHLILGFAISVAALLFVSIAAAVGGRQTIVNVDVALADALHVASSPGTTRVLQTITWLGNGWVVAGAGAAVGLVLLWRRRLVLTAGWTIALIGAGTLNQALKSLYERPRPSFTEPLIVADGWSFPSGHAMGTFVLVGMGSYLGWRLARTTPARLAIVSVASSWAVVMGFTRMYLGAHYLSDVVAGYAAGTVWLAACISGLEIALRRPRVPAIDAASATPPAQPLPPQPLPGAASGGGG